MRLEGERNRNHHQGITVVKEGVSEQKPNADHGPKKYGKKGVFFIKERMGRGTGSGLFIRIGTSNPPKGKGGEKTIEKQREGLENR